MTIHHETTKQRIATRAAFFVAGFAISCWAPLVPFAKSNVGADEAQLGLLLLCLGIGSLVTMPVTGVLSARIGARPIMIFGGFGMALVVPFLMLASTQWELAALLFALGASLGALDVSMNVHGARIEELEKRTLMSGFHALFSIGALIGAAFTTAMLSFGFTPVVAGIAIGVLSGFIMVASTPHFLRARGEEPEPFAWPKGVVLLLALLTGILFLAEGVVLDWSSLLMIERGLASSEGAGVGYILFSITMVAGRLSGDRITRALGAFRVLFYGGIAAALGFFIVVVAPGQGLALIGFAMIGAGAANIVPNLFSLAGSQKVMPAGLAIASISIVGYAGILLGPATIGFVAEHLSLRAAFLVVAGMLVVLPLTARLATK